jgi:hypothetical protein
MSIWRTLREMSLATREGNSPMDGEHRMDKHYSSSVLICLTWTTMKCLLEYAAAHDSAATKSER